MTLRSKLIRLAHEQPALRDDLLPMIHEAGVTDKLKSLWETYKKNHPNAKEPPKSLVDKANQWKPSEPEKDVWGDLGRGLKRQREEK